MTTASAEPTPPVPPEVPKAERIAADRRRLAELFPAAFPSPGSDEARPPLAIGTLEALLARGATTTEGLPFSRTRLRDALADYARGALYLGWLLDAEARIDLDGNPAGEVTEHQKEIARAALARLERQREAERRPRPPIAWKVYYPPRSAAVPPPPPPVPAPEPPRAAPPPPPAPPATPPAPSRGGAVTVVRGGSGAHRTPRYASRSGPLALWPPPAGAAPAPGCG